MVNEGNVGVAYLIECAERSTSEDQCTKIYAALAEAGGTAAQEYLVNLARRTSSSTKKEALFKLIGQASRE